MGGTREVGTHLLRTCIRGCEDYLQATEEPWVWRAWCGANQLRLEANRAASPSLFPTAYKVTSCPHSCRLCADSSAALVDWIMDDRLEGCSPSRSRFTRIRHNRSGGHGRRSLGLRIELRNAKCNMQLAVSQNDSGCCWWKLPSLITPNAVAEGRPLLPCCRQKSAAIGRATHW